jgi:hypothetical protein
MWCARSWSAGPMPDSSNSCGVFTAPAATITSRVALACCHAPSRR